MFLRSLALILPAFMLTSCSQGPAASDPSQDRSVSRPSVLTSSTAAVLDGDQVRTAQVVRMLVESTGINIGTQKSPIIDFPRTRTVSYPEGGVALGQGWNSFRDEKTAGTCIVFEPNEEGGQSADIQVKRITDSDHLRHEVGATYAASVQAKFGSAGGSGSYRTEFVRSAELNRNVLDLLVVGKIRNGMTFTAPPKDDQSQIRLSPYALSLLPGAGVEADSAADLDTFVRHCGDSFVTAIERGAELYALYQFGSAEKKTAVSKSTSIDVKANYLAFSGSASTSRKEVIDTINSREVVGLKYTHMAHRGLRLPYNEESVYATLSNLGSALELADAYPIRVSLVRYDSLPDWNLPRLLFGAAAPDPLIAFHLRLADLLDVSERIEDFRNEFRLTEAPDLVSASRMSRVLRLQVEQTRDLIARCQGAIDNTVSLAHFNSAIPDCLATASASSLTDYPYRAAMPLPQAALVPAQKSTVQKEYQEKISKVQAEFNRAGIWVPEVRGPPNSIADRDGFLIPCRKVPNRSPCRELAARIASLTQEMKLAVAKSEVLDLAESRFVFWIKNPAYARKEAGLVNGTLSQSALAMYRRDIYCQYGLSVDSIPCSLRLMPEIVTDGLPNLVKSTMALSVESAPFSTEVEAWNDAQAKAVREISQQAEGNPHHFVWLSDDTELIVTDDKFRFRIRGNIEVHMMDVKDNVAALLH